MAGDGMLREVAALIRDAVRDSDTVGRLGGDEFGMLLVGCPLEKARQIADDVVRAVARLPLRLEGQDLQHRRQRRPRRALARERLARGRDQRGRFRLLRGQEAGRARAGVLRARRGRGAQPRRDPLAAAAAGRAQGRPLRAVRAADRRRRGEHRARGPGLEVLLRLKDDSGVTVAPGEFMRAAERYRLMPHVDRWVVQTALAALGRGALRLPPGRSLCINLSGQTLGDAEFLEFVVDCLDRTGVAPDARLLRGDRELGDHQHRARAPLHRRAARHGLPVRARRLRPRPELVRQPQEPAARLPEDRRLLHPQPGVRHRQPGDGDGDDQAGALAQLPASSPSTSRT